MNVQRKEYYFKEGALLIHFVNGQIVKSFKVLELRGKTETSIQVLIHKSIKTEMFTIILLLKFKNT